MVMKADSRGIPPYIGWATWNRLTRLMKTFVPPRLDRSYFNSLGFSGTQYSQAVRAFLFLRLMDESKKPTETLRQLVMGTDEERRTTLKSVIEKAYQPFFENPGPQKATLGDLESFLRSQGAKGVIDKCVTFFLAAAREADIPLSPQLAGEFGRKTGRRIRGRKKVLPRQPMIGQPSHPSSPSSCTASSPAAAGLPQGVEPAFDGLQDVLRLSEGGGGLYNEGVATVKKPVRSRATKDPVARVDENETARRRRSAVVDARAELLRSAPAEPPQPSVPEIKVFDAASERDAGTALTSAASVAELHSRRLTPEPSAPGQVDVEQLLAAAPAPPAIPVGARIAEAHDEERSWTVTWLGVLLMTLGGLSILGSSRTLRHTIRPRH